MSDEFESNEKPREKIVIEDRRVTSELDTEEKDPSSEPKVKSAKEKKQRKHEPAPPDEGEEMSEEQVVANIFDLGIERFIQYNLGVIIQFAYVYMGLVANPSTGLVTLDLARAKQTIDIFEYLSDKVKGSLLPAEADELARIVKDLKANFLNVASTKPPSAPPSGGTAGG